MSEPGDKAIDQMIEVFGGPPPPRRPDLAAGLALVVWIVVLVALRWLS